MKHDFRWLNEFLPKAKINILMQIPISVEDSFHTLFKIEIRNKTTNGLLTFKGEWVNRYGQTG